MFLRCLDVNTTDPSYFTTLHFIFQMLFIDGIVLFYITEL